MGYFRYCLSLKYISTIYFQDLNIPVPASQSSNEPNAKRPRIDSSDLTSSNTSIEGTKVYSLPNGTVPCNKSLSELMLLVKPHIRELVEDSNLVNIKCFFIYCCSCIGVGLAGVRLAGGIMHNTLQCGTSVQFLKHKLDLRIGYT